MKRFVIVLLLAATQLSAQEKMSTKKGQITFEASIPSFEEVKATTESAACTLNTKTGEITSQAQMKSFKFRTKLMEEHFNDNYIESHRYPKTTFKGKINEFKLSEITENTKNFMIQGVMQLHGKSKDVSMPAKIRKTENGIEITSNFTLNTDDFDIHIPAVVRSKVSKKVDIKSTFVVK